MRSKTLRLILFTACLAVTVWATPRTSRADACPADSCGTLRATCENAGGHFTQTYVTVCTSNGSKPVFNWICESATHQFTDGVCYGI